MLSLMVAAVLAAIPTKAITVYYNNPNGWSAVSAYFYNSSGNNTWPGTAMTQDGKLYKVDVPSGYESAQVIFNNNNNGQQYPESNGLQLAGESMICLGTTIWTEYIDHSFKVYFDNSTEKWATPYIHYWGATETTWPGTAMTQVTGTDIWEYTVPAGTGGVIFTNGASSGTLKSSDLAAKEDHIYNKTADKGTYDPTSYGQPFDIYFDNFGTGWTTPYAHYWGGTSESTWPGEAMTLSSGTIYKITVPAGTSGVLFNAGDGDATKTSNFTANANHVYTQSGDQGDISTYTRTVSMPDALYILGNINGVDWATTPGVTMTKSGNTFTATGVVIKPASGASTEGYFTFVTVTGDDWNAVNAGDRYGAPEEDVVLTNDVASTMSKYTGSNAGNSKSWKLANGTYTIVADFENMTVKATLTGTGPVAGDGALTVADLTVKQGSSANMAVRLTADDAVRNFQFDVELPTGFTAGTAVGTALLPSAFTVQSNTQTDGKLRVVVTSQGNTTVSGALGNIVTIPVTCAATVATGDYTVNFSNIVISDENGNAIKPEAMTSKITVEEAEATLTLDRQTLTLQVGDEETLVATLTPASAGTVTWVSNNTAIATVDANGKVTGVGKGTTVVSAVCGALSANCTVTVGYLPQTITWDQDLSAPIAVGDEVTLTATASSNLAVTYQITNGSNYATITDGKLKATAVGVVTILASQAGSDTYAQAEPVSKTITIWAGYYDGDVNGDGSITLADVTATINYILGYTVDPFNVDAADLDGDGEITVNDVTRIVDKVLATTTPSGKARRVNASGEQFSLNAVNDYTLSVTFTNQSEYVATMFDLTLPEGLSVSNAFTSGTNHIVATAVNDNVTRLLVYSMDNATFAAGGSIMVVLSGTSDEEITLTGAVLNRIDGTSIIETTAQGASTTLSGVESIGVDAEGAVEYYNLQGIRVANPSTGVYIRRTATGAEKVLVK